MANQFDTPSALLFDVFGTVVDWRRSITRDLQHYFLTLDIERDWEQFALDWRALYQPAMQTIRSGSRGYVPLDVLHRENLELLVAQYELASLDESQLDHVNRTWHRLQPWADTLPGMNRLHRRYILASLSNGNTALMVNMARFSGLPWDAILGADAAQDYKPQPGVYQTSAERLGLQPEQCVMVAAHNDDLLAARALGFQTAYINRPDEYGAGQDKDLNAEESWDYIGDTMTDIADQLGC